jgi:putative glutamine amidotransferase
MFPLIAITGDVKSEPDKPDKVFFIKKRYFDAVLEAGGIPLLIPPYSNENLFAPIRKMIQGLIITGGDFDIHPEKYGQKPREKLGNIIPERTDSETALLEYALKKNIPVLGICGGHQLINVYFGGTLLQDIGLEYSTEINHSPGNSLPSHNITINHSSMLYEIFRSGRLKVNSTHHQAIDKLATGFIASAKAEDGIIEAIEREGGSFLVGLQFHPEALVFMPEAKNLFKRFINESSKVKPE